MRITWQLIEAETGNHLWAERYDRELTDIFAIQDEITQNVVAAIEPEMLLVEVVRPELTRPQQPGLYDVPLLIFGSPAAD